MNPHELTPEQFYDLVETRCLAETGLSIDEFCAWLDTGEVDPDPDYIHLVLLIGWKPKADAGHHL